MPKPIQWVLSLIFIVQMYLAMAVIAIVYLPYALFHRDGAVAACHAFCRWVCFSVRIICGLKTEVRGTPPVGEVLVAAKHQSFLDILMIYGAIPRGKFVMKAILAWAPFLGWYAKRIGCIFVDRGKRGAAITKMLADVKSGQSQPGQIVIYPQGTRVAPGSIEPYKVGSAVLYGQLKQPCVPVGTNAGVLWPKRGIMRKRGTAVVEFLPAIAPGLSNADFMARLEKDVETSSNALMAEAGF
jgi:1-acyl-sn-glycerol-3-phosphate acyltransferase